MLIHMQGGTTHAQKSELSSDIKTNETSPNENVHVNTYFNHFYFHCSVWITSLS